MQTIIVTLMYIVAGFALSFEIARRTKGLTKGILAYGAGFLAVFFTMSVTALYEIHPNELLAFGPLVAFIAPVVGVFFGRARPHDR